MKRTIARLFRLTLSMKLLLGFLSCGILTVLIAHIALSNLQRLNEINDRVITRDILLEETANEMIDTLLAQERYGRRSLILKSSELEALFWKKSDEFKMLRRQIGNLLNVSDLPLARIATLHREYNRLYQAGFENADDFSSSAYKGHVLIQKEKEELLELLQRIARDGKKGQSEKSLETVNISHSTFWTVSGLTAGGLLLGIIIALVITHNISRSIKQLELSTREISKGKFDRLPEVHSQDELGDLSRSFQRMAQSLKSLEERHLDANPLTYLPGSITIENVLNKRLKNKTPTAFCQLDLNNFKAFNDRYGYARGNEIIQMTANIVTETVNTEGNEGDFVGHIGGDDFVVITSPKTYERICRVIIDSFDKRVPDLYDPEDRQRGYIRGETRQGESASFPVMTMAISVVTNQYCPLQNHIQVAEIAAEIKNYAKSFPHSTFVVDRRVDNVSRLADRKTLLPAKLGK